MKHKAIVLIKNRYVCFFGFLLFCICSCKTIKPRGSGIIQGMVYDYENLPVSGYAIQITEKDIVFTDINGRFMLGPLAYGTYQILGTGNKHITIKQNYDFNDKTEILHIQIPSFAWIYKQTDVALEKKDTVEAMRLLNQLPESEKDSMAYQLYYAIAEYLHTDDSVIKEQAYTTIIMLTKKLEDI